jgi:hypothetical protein
MDLRSTFLTGGDQNMLYVNQKHKCVCAMLSGTGSNGGLDPEAVKDVGSFAIAMDR